VKGAQPKWAAPLWFFDRTVRTDGRFGRRGVSSSSRVHAFRRISHLTGPPFPDRSRPRFGCMRVGPDALRFTAACIPSTPCCRHVAGGLDHPTITTPLPTAATDPSRAHALTACGGVHQLQGSRSSAKFIAAQNAWPDLAAGDHATDIELSIEVRSSSGDCLLSRALIKIPASFSRRSGTLMQHAFPMQAFNSCLLGVCWNRRRIPDAKVYIHRLAFYAPRRVPP